MRGAHNQLSVPAAGCLLELDSNNSNMVVQSTPGSDLWGDFSAPARYAPLFKLSTVKTCGVKTLPDTIPLVQLLFSAPFHRHHDLRTPETGSSFELWEVNFDILSSSRMHQCPSASCAPHRDCVSPPPLTLKYRCNDGSR